MSAPLSCDGLSCRGLTKGYDDGGSRTNILNNTSFQASRSCTSFVVGASGSGKSTLLAIVAGLLRSDSGSVSLDGERIDAASSKQWSLLRRSKIGIVLQQFQLLPALTVRENISVPLQILGRRSREIAEAVRVSSERVGLARLLDRYPSELSVGQKQRVGIARATIHEPSLLLCDEPTAALDQEATQHTIQLLRDYAASFNSTVVVVTHDLDLIRKGDPTWRIENGMLKPWQAAQRWEQSV